MVPLTDLVGSPHGIAAGREGHLAKPASVKGSLGESNSPKEPFTDTQVARRVKSVRGTLTDSESVKVAFTALRGS